MRPLATLCSSSCAVKSAHTLLGSSDARAYNFTVLLPPPLPPRPRLRLPEGRRSALLPLLRLLLWQRPPQPLQHLLRLLRQRRIGQRTHRCGRQLRPRRRRLEGACLLRRACLFGCRLPLRFSQLALPHQQQRLQQLAGPAWLLLRGRLPAWRQQNLQVATGRAQAQPRLQRQPGRRQLNGHLPRAAHKGVSR